MNRLVRRYPSSTLFLTYIAVMVTVLFLLELFRG